MVVFHVFKIVQMVPNRATNTYIFTKKLLNENKDFEWKLFFRMNTSFLNKKTILDEILKLLKMKLLWILKLMNKTKQNLTKI